MIIVSLIISLVALALSYSSVRTVRRYLNGKPIKTIIPHFSREAHCAQCDKKIKGEPTEVYAIIPVNDTNLPVSIKICEDCVARA